MKTGSEVVTQSVNLSSRFGERLDDAPIAQPEPAAPATPSAPSATAPQHSAPPVHHSPGNGNPGAYTRMSREEFARLEKEVGFIEANRRSILRAQLAAAHRSSNADSS